MIPPIGTGGKPLGVGPFWRRCNKPARLKSHVRKDVRRPVTERLIQRVADDAGLGLFGIADDARFVNLFAGDADISTVRFRNSAITTISPLTPPRSCAASYSSASLRFDLERIGLRAICSRDELVVSLLRLSEAGRLLRGIISDGSEIARLEDLGGAGGLGPRSRPPVETCKNLLLQLQGRARMFYSDKECSPGDLETIARRLAGSHPQGRFSSS
ncbi:hypothetical protein [Bradyrhizobium sp. ARR65]|uniref:hypothetical protein n=1 Tax=Bradyrhizobium sp. ARR65 TaxID=1040989 RepID=UPI000465DE4D|nr:hypothetical protein [Bradyrhizobium sp. ARR65]